MTKQNFCFVILAACKGKKCLGLIDEYEFTILPACYLVLEPQLEVIDIIPLDKVLHGGGAYTWNRNDKSKFLLHHNGPIYPLNIGWNVLPSHAGMMTNQKICFVNTVTIHKDFHQKI